MKNLCGFLLFSLLLKICFQDCRSSHPDFEKIRKERRNNRFDFLKNLLLNEWDMTTFRFRTTSKNYTYVALCSYPVLSMKEMHSLDCLTVALSILVTNPNYPFVLLIPSKTIIKSDFRAMMNRLGILPHIFQEIHVPQAAIDSHTRAQRQNWIICYQSLSMYRLPYLRAVYIDTDQLILKNLDHLFDNPKDTITTDCGPHFRSISNEYNPGYKIVAIYAFTPSIQTFNLLNNELQNGVIYDPNNDTNIKWKWTVADQDLITTLLPLDTLPCQYQMYPDVCLFAHQPSTDFPLYNAYGIHFAWMHYKGVKFLNSSSFSYTV
eukprot:gene15144-32122_t